VVWSAVTACSCEVREDRFNGSND